MKYLLDTNVCIRYIARRIPSLIAKLSAADRDDFAVSMITKAELFYGSAKSQTPDISRQKQENFLRGLIILTLDDAVVDHYARIRADLERRGTPIGANDLFIAATALAHDLTLITHNTGEFGRILNLKIEDWEV
jgi:tRNA(fMet)-specific endonuclease VapC